MSSVIDSSVVIAALIDTGPLAEWAEGTLVSGSLHAPELIQVEVTNILRRLERARKITAFEAQAAYDDLLQLHLELFPFEPFANRIWQLRHNVTGYDAWYVAVAEALDLPFATLDRRLIKSNGPTCRFLTPRRR